MKAGDPTGLMIPIFENCSGTTPLIDLLNELCPEGKFKFADPSTAGIVKTDDATFCNGASNAVHPVSCKWLCVEINASGAYSIKPNFTDIDFHEEIHWDPVENITMWSSASLVPYAFFAALMAICSSGCSRPYADTKTPAYYFSNLRNESFEWHGPCSRETIIPTLHAARALAFLGDPGVPFLFDAIDDPTIEIESIYLALLECGVPVDAFEDEVIGQRSSVKVRDWWYHNQLPTIDVRSKHRLAIGLPAIQRKR